MLIQARNNKTTHAILSKGMVIIVIMNAKLLTFLFKILLNSNKQMKIEWKIKIKYIQNHQATY